MLFIMNVIDLDSLNDKNADLLIRKINSRLVENVKITDKKGKKSNLKIDPYKSFDDNSKKFQKKYGVFLENGLNDFTVSMYDESIEKESLLVLSEIDNYIEKFMAEFTEKNNLVVQDYFMEEKYYDPVYRDKLLALKENVVSNKKLETFISQMIDVYDFSFRRIPLPDPSDFVNSKRYSESWNNFLTNYTIKYPNLYSLYVSSTTGLGVKRKLGPYFYNFNLHCNNIIDNLGEEYKDALQEYTQEYYRDIKSFLRDRENYINELRKTISPKEIDERIKLLKKSIKLIDKVFNILPVLNQSITVYRGSKDETLDDDSIIDYTSKIFVSTSLEISQAKIFAGKKCCLFYITIPAGLKIIPMTRYSIYNEEEILLPRNTKYQVVNIEEPFEWEGRIVTPKKFYLTRLN